jgi:hypothetical protein
MRYLVYTPKFGLWYPKGSTFDLIGYSDDGYAGCKIDIKSTSGICQFLGRSLVSWATNKQNSIALSTTESEYIAVGHLLELALPSKLIQWGSESNVNKVSIRDGNSSVNLASQGHCAGVFIGI